MALPFNRPLVRSILDELGPKIIGRELEARPGCRCGAHQGYEPARAIYIEPGGGDCPGDEACWACWTVRCQCADGSGYPIGLSRFLPVPEIERLFGRFDQDRSEREAAHYQFRPDAQERVERGLCPAISVAEHRPDLLAVRVLVGREYWLGEFAYRMCWTEWEELQRLAVRAELAQILGGIEPVFHIGGPPPELESEVIWHGNLELVFRRLEDPQSMIKFLNFSGRPEDLKEGPPMIAFTVGLSK